MNSLIKLGTAFEVSSSLVLLLDLVFGHTFLEVVFASDHVYLAVRNNVHQFFVVVLQFLKGFHTVHTVNQNGCVAPLEVKIENGAVLLLASGIVVVVFDSVAVDVCTVHRHGLRAFVYIVAVFVSSEQFGLARRCHAENDDLVGCNKRGFVFTHTRPIHSLFNITRISNRELMWAIMAVENAHGGIGKQLSRIPIDELFRFQYVCCGEDYLLVSYAI